MDKVGIETARGGFANTLKEADKTIEDMPFPVIIRPSFTMGGTGGSVAYNIEEFHELVEMSNAEFQEARKPSFRNSKGELVSYNSHVYQAVKKARNNFTT